MKAIKILAINERVALHDALSFQPLNPPVSHARSANYRNLLYEFLYTLDGGLTVVRIERTNQDILILIQSLVLYFPSYQFSALSLFDPPDQRVHDLLELQEFLNRIFSIDVGSRLIQYPKIIGFFDPVFARSVVQRSLVRAQLKSMSNIERSIDSFNKRLDSLESTLSQCVKMLNNLQLPKDRSVTGDQKR